MSADVEQWPPPEDSVAFESLCLDLWREIWQDASAQKNGRSGQPQGGVDVFGIAGGMQVGIQCKQKSGLLHTKVTVAELESEVQEALAFRPKLSTLIIATTGPRDVRVQERARLISEEHRGQGLFTVEIWSWSDIWRELYQSEELLQRIGPIYWPRLANSRPYRKKLKILGAIVLLVAIGWLLLWSPKPQYSFGNISGGNNQFGDGNVGFPQKDALKMADNPSPLKKRCLNFASSIEGFAAKWANTNWTQEAHVICYSEFTAEFETPLFAIQTAVEDAGVYNHNLNKLGRFPSGANDVNSFSTTNILYLSKEIRRVAESL